MASRRICNEKQKTGPSVITNWLADLYISSVSEGVPSLCAQSARKIYSSFNNDLGHWGICTIKRDASGPYIMSHPCHVVKHGDLWSLVNFVCHNQVPLANRDVQLIVCGIKVDQIKNLGLPHKLYKYIVPQQVVPSERDVQTLMMSTPCLVHGEVFTTGYEPCCHALPKSISWRGNEEVHFLQDPRKRLGYDTPFRA